MANVSGTAGSFVNGRSEGLSQRHYPLPAAISRIIKGRDFWRFVCAGQSVLFFQKKPLSGFSVKQNLMLIMLRWAEYKLGIFVCHLSSPTRIDMVVLLEQGYDITRIDWMRKYPFVFNKLLYNTIRFMI